MKYETTLQIVEHLEYLGYRVDVYDTEENRDIIFGLCDTKTTLKIYNNQANNILIMGIFNVKTDKANESKLFALLNEINLDSWLTKWSHKRNEDDRELLFVEANMLGYNKSKFAYLLERFNLETDKYLPKLSDLWI